MKNLPLRGNMSAEGGVEAKKEKSALFAPRPQHIECGWRESPTTARRSSPAWAPLARCRPVLPDLRPLPRYPLGARSLLLLIELREEIQRRISGADGGSRTPKSYLTWS